MIAAKQDEQQGSKMCDSIISTTFKDQLIAINVLEYVLPHTLSVWLQFLQRGPETIPPPAIIFLSVQIECIDIR